MAATTEESADGGILLTLIFCLIIYLIFLVIYLIIRKYFPYVYFPNERDNPKQKKLLAWIIPTLLIPEREVMKRNGIKGALFLEWKTCSIYFLCFVCVSSLPVLIPVYWANSPYDFFYAMAASGLTPNDNVTWLTFAVSILLSVYILSMLFYHRYRYYTLSRKHRKMGGTYLCALKMQGIQNTYHNDEELKQDLMKYNPDMEGFHSVHIAWRYPSLWNCQKSRMGLEENLKAYNDIKDHKGEGPKLRPKRFKLPGILTCNKEVDAIEWTENELANLATRIRSKQEKLLSNQKKYNPGIAFLLFDSPKYKNLFKESSKSKKQLFLLNRWSFYNAKNPEDILWNNLNSTWKIRTIPQIITAIFMVILAALWAIPIAFLSQLSNFTDIPVIGPAIETFLAISPWLASFAQSLLPAILTTIFFAILPKIAYFLSTFERHHSQSSLEASAMIKMWIFFILNGLVFLMIFMGSINIINNLERFADDWQSAFEELDWSKYGSFYCNWLIVQTFIGGIFKLLVPVELIVKNVKRFLYRNGTPNQKEQIYEPIERKYYVSFALEALYMAVCLLFAPIVPIVSACGFVFYCVNQSHDKINITLLCSYEVLKGGKMVNRFGFFICATMLYVYLCWTFFFLAHGPKLIGYIAGPIYLSFWILFVIILLSSNYIVKFINKKRGLSEDNENINVEELNEEPYLFPGLKGCDN